MQNIENHMNTNNNNNANPFHIAYNLWRHYKAQKININQDELLTIDQLWTVKKFFLALLLTVRKILTKKTAQQWEEEEEKIIFISQKFSLSLDFFLFLFFFDDSSSTKKYVFTYEKYLSNICIQNILKFLILFLRFLIQQHWLIITHELNEFLREFWQWKNETSRFFLSKKFL